MNRSASVDLHGTVPGTMEDAAAFRAIAGISGEAAFIIDCPGGSARYLSPAFEQLLGNSLDQLAPVIDALAERARLVAGGNESARLATHSMEITNLDGATVPVQVVSTLVTDATGRAAAVSGVIRDLSAQRERDAQQKRFASMLNHEFRTPLSTIDGAIQRLQATSPHADEPTRQRYRKIAVAVDRLIGMLDEYLSPDRMAGIGKTRAPNAVAPGQLLEEAAAQARAAGREVLLALEGLPPSLRCDPAGLRLAMKVLVDNALMFSPAGSPVELAGRTIANGIELTVRDHGAGVPGHDAARIFDKSYRGSNAAGLPGNGLGLYMAKSVLEVHGGAIELVSSRETGALFKIFLPIGIVDGKSIAMNVSNSDNRSNKAGVDAKGAPQP